MANRFSPGCTCCGLCADCCGGSLPNEFRLTISGLTGTWCGTGNNQCADDFGGVYILPFKAAPTYAWESYLCNPPTTSTGICVWELRFVRTCGLNLAFYWALVINKPTNGDCQARLGLFQEAVFFQPPVIQYAQWEKVTGDICTSPLTMSNNSCPPSLAEVQCVWPTQVSLEAV